MERNPIVIRRTDDAPIPERGRVRQWLSGHRVLVEWDSRLGWEAVEDMDNLIPVHPVDW